MGTHYEINGQTVTDQEYFAYQADFQKRWNTNGQPVDEFAPTTPPQAAPQVSTVIPPVASTVTYDAMGNVTGGNAGYTPTTGPTYGTTRLNIAHSVYTGPAQAAKKDYTGPPQRPHSVYHATQAATPAATAATTAPMTATTTAHADFAKDLDSVSNIRDKLFDLNTFDGNVLSQYDNTAYHFRFFMTSNIDIVSHINDSTTRLHDTLSKVPTVTIAESGVTGFNIKDVQIDSVVGPSVQTRNMNATKIVITIVEPMGTNLFDRIFAAAENLHIRNYSKMYYYLELSFKGYDSTYGFVDNNLCGGFANGGIWIYQLSILDIETNLDAGGTTYVITTIPHNEAALQPDMINLPDNITASALNIGDAVNVLKTALNKTVKERYADYQLISYDFVLHDVKSGDKVYDHPGNFNLAVETTKTNIRPANFVDGTNAAPTAHFQRGTTIADCIETLYANSVLGGYLIKDVNKPDALSDGKTAKDRFRESVLFRVEPDITVKEFDPITLTYRKEVTFHVWAYTTQIPILSLDQVLAAKDDAVQTAMVQKMKNDGLLAKRYDYLFTGLNTEVMSIDLKYNLAWAAVLPKFAGMLNSYDQLTDVGAKRNTDIVGARQVNSYFVYDQDRLKHLKEANDVLRLVAANGTEGLTDEQKSVLAAQSLPDDQRKKLDNANEQRAMAKTILGTNEAEIAGKDGLQAKVDAEIALISKQRAAEQAASSAADQKAGLTSISPTTVDASYAEDAVLASAPTDEPPIPISILQANEDPRNQVTGPLTGSYHRDMSIYGSVLNQLYGPMTKQLVNITLEIKGDPYWIGPSNLDRRLILNGKANSNLFSATFPDFTKGDNHFLLSFRYPQGIDEGGAPILKNQEQFDGIYAIRNITHSFSNGLFKQTINAFIVPLVTVLKSFSAAKKDSTAKPPATTTPVTPTPVTQPTQTAKNPAISPVASADTQLKIDAGM